MTISRYSGRWPQPQRPGHRQIIGCIDVTAQAGPRTGQLNGPGTPMYSGRIGTELGVQRYAEGEQHRRSGAVPIRNEASAVDPGGIKSLREFMGPQRGKVTLESHDIGRRSGDDRCRGIDRVVQGVGVSVRGRISQDSGAQLRRGGRCLIVGRDDDYGFEGRYAGSRRDGVGKHRQHHPFACGRRERRGKARLGGAEPFDGDDQAGTGVRAVCARPRDAHVGHLASGAEYADQGLAPADQEGAKRRGVMTATLGTATVMGAGAWGTALAKVLADAGNDVRLWARTAAVAEQINSSRRNPDYLGDVEVPSAVEATSDAAAALAGVTTVLLAVPSQALRENLDKWNPLLTPDATLVSLAKGIELGTLMRMSQVIIQVTGVDPSQVAVLSGPNLASEIAAEQPAATVIASTDSGRVVALQRGLSTGYFRPYTNSDVIGTEIGGACKNVIALACGMAAGVGLGENTAAAIITRGLAEIMRLGIAVGAKEATLAGLAGVGDLVATCSSPRSRNRAFGERLGRGETIAAAQRAAGGHVAEGVTSCESILALASSYDVEMPLTDAVHRVCHRGMSVSAAVAALLGRRTKPE